MRAEPNTGRAARPDTGPLHTEVELTSLIGRIEHWIRFDHDRGDTIFDRHRRVLRFAPREVFALVRWASNDSGTIVSRIDIVRVVDPGESYQTLAFRTPGWRDSAADQRLAEGRARAELALQPLDLKSLMCNQSLIVGGVGSGIADGEVSVEAPVDLRSLAGCKLQLQKDRALRRVQPLKNLLCAELAGIADLGGVVAL